MSAKNLATAKRRVGPTKAAAAEYGVTQQTIRDWWRAGIIDGRMIDGRLYVYLDSALVVPAARRPRAAKP